MFDMLKVRFGGLLNRLVTKFHKVDDTPETIIHQLCDKLEGDIENLTHALTALDARENDNLELIRQIETENAAIEVQADRADKLRTGLNNLLNGSN